MVDHKRKKVAFFIGTLAKGGAERAVSTISNHLSQDIDCQIILYGTQTRIDYPVKGELVYIDQIRKNTRLNKFLSILTRVNRLKQMKIKNPETTFISFLEYPNLLNVLTSKYARTIISVRNHMSTKNRKGLKSLFWRTSIRWFYNRADVIIAVSQDIKQDLINTFGINPDKIKVIYNAYDLAAIESKSKESPPDNLQNVLAKPTLVSMGRLNWQKGHLQLIRAFQKVTETNPDVNLLIMGEGQLEQKIRDYIQVAELSDRIYLSGFVSNPHAVIARSRGFVLSSVVEGFPNALAEAMACHVPVIAADCHSGPREILAPDEFNQEPVDYSKIAQSNRYGYLVPVGDSTFRGHEIPLTAAETAMAAAMTDLLTDADFHAQMTFRAQKRIQDFALEHVMTTWENMI